MVWGFTPRGGFDPGSIRLGRNYGARVGIATLVTAIAKFCGLILPRPADLIHLVHALILLPSGRRVHCKFGSRRRSVFCIEWERDWERLYPLPQMAQILWVWVIASRSSINRIYE